MRVHEYTNSSCPSHSCIHGLFADGFAGPALPPLACKLLRDTMKCAAPHWRSRVQPSRVIRTWSIADCRLQIASGAYQCDRWATEAQKARLELHWYSNIT